MNNIKQSVALYKINYSNIDILDCMNDMIRNGWRVHTCLERNGEVLVVYEKELDSWN